MPKLNAREARAALELCIKRDGKKCNVCGRGPVGAGNVEDQEKQVWRLVLNHLNHDPAYNPDSGANWDARCDSCNGKNRRPYKKQGLKHKRFKELGASLRARKRVREAKRPRSPEMVKAEEAEKFLRVFISEHFKSSSKEEEKELLNAAANRYYELYNRSVHQKTLKRVLEKMCNRINGSYESVEEGDIWIIRKRQP